MTRSVPGSAAAKNSPVIINRTIESGDTPPTPGLERLLRSDGDAKEALDPIGPVVQVVDRVVDEEHAAMLRFMNEIIEVRIATSTDKQAEQIIEFGINGQVFSFLRGVPKKVPRYVVDRLARCKLTSYRQEERFEDNVKHIVNIPITGVRYDFSVTYDASPYADAWLRSVLAERG